MSNFCRASHVPSWTRRISAAVAATVAVTAVGVLPAHAADAESAVTLNAWVSHPFTDVVDSPVQVSRSTPKISGTVKVGQTLTANPGTWTPGATLAYRWMADGVTVRGETGSTLVLGPGQAGKAITVRVAGSKPGYLTASRFSAATAAVAKGTFAAYPPRFRVANALFGSILTANPSFSPVATLSYQWHRSGVAIAGATSRAYKLAKADVGENITVNIIARKVGYTASARINRRAVKVWGLALTAPKPAIAGTPAVGQTLTAKAGIWLPTGVALTYEWNRNGSPIPGATASTYTVASADLGSALSIRVIGHRTGGYLAKAVTSDLTSPVAEQDGVMAP